MACSGMRKKNLKGKKKNKKKGFFHSVMKKPKKVQEKKFGKAQSFWCEMIYQKQQFKYWSNQNYFLYSKTSLCCLRLLKLISWRKRRRGTDEMFSEKFSNPSLFSSSTTVNYFFLLFTTQIFGPPRLEMSYFFGFNIKFQLKFCLKFVNLFTEYKSFMMYLHIWFHISAFYS